MITAGATITIIGLSAIGVALVEKHMYKKGKEEVGYLINVTTKTILVIGGIVGIGILLIHAVGRFL